MRKIWFMFYDCSQELCRAVEANVNGGIYNVGTGVPVTIKEQIETIVEVFSPKDKKVRNNNASRKRM